ncbi:hypothetical protein MM213_08460 [Belliella sp. R4-6]|uniref:Uncharacterized protein n=1 Tax=Belliella alkalica TaxID=1730871 RepID=A0ABS9VCA8_9BACT|nr:hypothetical protein [Belliella alkalica]MCH7413513.1 hypothetical protein [Belliella alkalica]
MKSAILTLILVYIIGMNGLCGQNLEFINIKSDGIYPKFVLIEGKTILSVQGSNAISEHIWSQVPVNFDNSDGRSRYKMVVSQNMGKATIAYEIFWMHIKSADRYTAHIKSTTDYNNGSKPVERKESFKGRIL